MAKAWNPLDHLVEVRKLAALGLSEKQIATKLNVHPDVLRHHRTKCKELEQAIQEGLNNTIIIATTQLQMLINQGDFKAIKFFLEKKGGWGDQIQVDGVNKPSFGTFQLNLVKKEENVDPD